MKLKEIKRINKRILAFKEKMYPAPKGRVAGRINRERNQQKRFSRRMRGVQ